MVDNPFDEEALAEAEAHGVRSIATFKFTDYGNAERLVQMFGDEMLYVPEWKCWLLWDGKRWRRDEDGGAERKAKQTVRALYAAAAATENDETRKAIDAHARRSEAAARLKAMADLAWSEHGMVVHPWQLDAHPYLFNVENGTLNLRSGELQRHDRTQLLTKVVPIPYDAATKCPRWDRFLREVLPDEEVRAFLQRAVGYSLTGENVEEVMFLLLGPGSNGKSKLLETLRLMFGPFAQAAPTALLMQNFADRIPTDVARLPGTRFVTVMESERGQRLAEGTIKSITSGDTISARGLYQNPFDFTPTCKLWLATNHLPQIKGDDDGIWRRILLVNFDQRIAPEKRDRYLLTKLRKELPGILRWAVDGCMAWQAQHLSPPPSVVRAVADYRKQEDVVGQFLEDCTENAAEAKVSTDELFNLYKRWCERCGINYPLTSITLGKALAERGYKDARLDTATTTGKRKRLRGFQGLAIRPWDQ